MKHPEIYEQFKSHFNMADDDIKEWFPNGSYCVRVRMKSGTELVFTYYHDQDWRLETKTSWLNSLKCGE
jgi:antitoxin component YwqK of YwqJK toxin-antitoxin module